MQASSGEVPQNTDREALENDHRMVGQYEDLRRVQSQGDLILPQSDKGSDPHHLRLRLGNWSLRARRHLEWHRLRQILSPLHSDLEVPDRQKLHVDTGTV